MEDRPLVSSLEVPQSSPKLNKKIIYIFTAIIVVLLGIASGIITASKTSANPQKNTQITSADIKTEKEFGSMNPAFKDEATGKLEKGGLNNEGTHHLVRPGGVSQTVYLVSSVVDLDQFEGKNVQVTGQTMRAKSVGWLMDVGRVKIID